MRPICPDAGHPLSLRSRRPMASISSASEPARARHSSSKLTAGSPTRTPTARFDSRTCPLVGRAATSRCTPRVCTHLRRCDDGAVHCDASDDSMTCRLTTCGEGPVQPGPLDRPRRPADLKNGEGQPASLRAVHRAQRANVIRSPISPPCSAMNGTKTSCPHSPSSRFNAQPGRPIKHAISSQRTSW